MLCWMSDDNSLYLSEVVVEKPPEIRASVVTESLKMTETMKTSPPPSEVTDIRRRILLSPGKLFTDKLILPVR